MVTSRRLSTLVVRGVSSVTAPMTPMGTPPMLSLRKGRCWARRPAGRSFVEDVGAKEGKLGLSDAGFEGACGVVRIRGWDGQRTGRTIVELMVADRRAVIAQYVVGGDDRLPFAQV